jgi:uncharacterized protein YndB with AHSA1/START domain
MSEIVTATARHRFADLSPQQVFDAWLDPGLVRAWMQQNVDEKNPGNAVTRIEIDPSVGGRFFFAGSREGTEAWGTYQVIDRPNRLVFTWFVSEEEERTEHSLVTLDLAPEGKGCEAVMRHEMGVAWADYLEQTANAWTSMLTAIERTLD